ncbi:uncharacterized protein LOC143252947 isoform X3 [Tachypleus tridentatus]|uniref:uncharacterized protein LOC143252947 isoform X3 n=1 Tax=Tachypleus tridentatus TaxID=6853 RepID=UPI003FCFB317
MLKMLMKRFPSVGNAIYQLQLLSRVVLAVAMVAEDQGQTDGNASFLRAARAGNFEKVLEYLKGSIDINTSNANGLNALHLASKEGHVNIVSELLKRGANVNAATKKGNTALHIASLAGQEAVVKILVQSGANVNVQSQNGFTPLYMAAQENHDNVVCFLLANGANQSLATEDGFTPLAVALQQGHDKVVAVLLENDAKGRVRLPALHIAAKKDDCKAAALLLQNDHNPDITSKSGFTPLHIAAHYGNDSIGRLLLEKGAEINYAAKHQITPLHVASKWGKANMATLLLDKGAKIDASTRDGLTPLHCAARSGHDHVVDLLLERGAPITAKTKNGLAPLHMASQGDHVDGARILLYHKAPVDDVTVDYLTALHVAAHCGHVRVAKLLLDRKADPNARALNGFTPLHIACKKNRIKVVELLLKHGASIEARTESGLTPLHVAAFMGNMNIVIFLIQHGADPDIPTVRGETPIHLAARANQADIIRILLRNGARVDAKAREHQTPLHIAARLGNVDIVSLLIQHGAAVDATTKDMYTALHIASKEGQEEVASVLLDNGASLTATTKKGFTPLHLAAKYGNIKVARLLLQKDAPVDAQGKNGVTPLHVAAHYDHVNVALLLLDKGASPHATAKNGYTPLHIAAKKSQMDIATTLLEYGAKANSESKAGFTPLHLAAQEGHTDMTTLLIEHRADVNMKAKNGLTPLHLCAQEDHVNVAAILVKNDAENDPETNAGYTPLHVACHFGQVNMVRFLLQHTANVNSVTSHGYTPLHQAAQQGHTLIISLLLENKASPNALTNQGQTALSIARRLGYISVVETLKVVTETTTITTTTTVVEEKYKVLAPETMQETFMSDSEDEGGDEIEDTALFGKPTHATHVYLPYYEGQKLQTREDTILGDQSMRYLTVDEMKSLGDDSLPIDVTKDERTAESMLLSADSGAPLTVEEDHLSPLHIRHDIESVFVSNYAADNVDISRAPVHAGFLVSFMVDARGGAMRGCRHSGVRVIIPPRKAPMPMRITCRYLRKEKLTHPPPLMEGEACASRILEIGPVGAKFLGPVIIEVPHFASLRGKEREITILRSDNGEAWREHTLEATEEAVQDVLNESFEGEELNALQDLNTSRITQILTTDFPQYFAIITRVRQEVHAIGPEGGMVSSTVVPQVQAIFPEGALTKKIKVGLQTQPIPPELVSKLLGNRVGVSPIVTVEPRRRKFHKPITLTIPVPQAATKGMINQYSGDAPTLRLLCSITGSRMSGGVTKAQWEDVTGSTPLTFVNDCVSFTTTVSARFWLMDCRQVNEVTKYATELYREAVHVPFMAKFVVFAKHYEAMEAQLRVFCMTDDKEDKTLESQEKFSEIAKSRDVEVFEGKFQYLEFAGNLVPVTKSGEQLALNFQAFRENRLPFVVRVKDPHQESVGRIAFMREPKVGRGEPPQTPICNLNIVLPDICKVEIKSVPTELVRLEKKYGFVEETGLAKPELIHRADLRLSDIARGLDQDWVQLADQLDISESDVNNIKKEQPNDSVQQALVMLRLWLQQVNEDATGNNLEKALRKIGREDIVNSCMFNVEIVTDDVEKAVAKVHLDQSGFDAFKDELGSSRDASLRRDISLDVSYDEQDIMKEAESAEETSSEAGSLHEKKPFTPEERKQEEESLAIKHNTETEETDDGQTSTTTTETGEILVDDTTKHSIISVTKTTVDHELRDQMTKQAGLEEWSSNGMETSQLSFSGLPEDEQSELSTISTIITLEPEVGEKKTEVDFNAVEKESMEGDFQIAAESAIMLPLDSLVAQVEKVEESPQKENEQKEIANSIREVDYGNEKQVPLISKGKNYPLSDQSLKPSVDALKYENEFQLNQEQSASSTTTPSIEVLMDRKVFDITTCQATSESKVTVPSSTVVYPLDIYFKTESQIQISSGSGSFSPKSSQEQVDIGIETDSQDRLDRGNSPAPLPSMTDTAVSPIVGSPTETYIDKQHDQEDTPLSNKSTNKTEILFDSNLLGNSEEGIEPHISSPQDYCFEKHETKDEIQILPFSQVKNLNIENSKIKIDTKDERGTSIEYQNLIYKNCPPSKMKFDEENQKTEVSFDYQTVVDNKEVCLPGKENSVTVESNIGLDSLNLDDYKNRQLTEVGSHSVNYVLESDQQEEYSKLVDYTANIDSHIDNFDSLNNEVTKENDDDDEEMVKSMICSEDLPQHNSTIQADKVHISAWAEKDESGAVQHTIQKEKQSTFTVKDGQSESHPGTESGDTTVSSSSSVVSKINQELKHEERGLSFTEKRDFFQKLSETYDSQAKKIDPSLDFTFHDGVDSDIQKSKDYDIQKIQMEIEHYPQKSEIIEEHKSFKERLHFFKTSIGESDQSGFPKGNIPTETSTKGMPKDIPENERKHKTDFTETVIKDTAVPASEFSEMFPEIVSNVGNEMRRKENISELAPKEQRMQKLCEVEENIQQELIKNHNGFALEMSAISDELSPLSDVIVKEGLQETFEEKSVQEISQTSLDEKVLVKPKQSIIDHEQLLIDWDLKQLEMQQDRVDKKILSDINTTVIDNKYLISSHSEEGDISEKNETLTKTKFEELKLSETEECKLKLEVSKTVKEEESLDMRKTEQTVLEQERFLSERNLEYQELQREEEMQDTELIQKFEDIQVSFEKEFPISISNTTEQIEKDFMYCLEEPRSTLAEDHLSKELETTKLEYTKQACSLTSESSTESFIQGEQFSTEKYETISMKKEIEQAQKNVSFNSEEEEREMLEKELEQTSLKDVEQQATSMLSEVSKESLVVEIGTTCDSEKTSEEDELWKEVEDSNESVKKEADSFEIDSQSPTEKERLDKQIISDASLSVTSTDLSRLPEQFVQKDKTESKTYREIIKDLKKESVIEIDDKQSVFSNQKSPSVSLTSQAFAPDSTVHQPQAASDTERESSHIEPAFPCTEHKHFSHEDKESPLSRPSPPETASYCAEREISPAADYTVYLVPEMQVHVGVSPTESKPATSERDKDEEKHIKKLEGDFCSKLVSEPLSETVKKPLTTSSPKKTYSEIQRTEYVYGSKGLKSSDDIEDVSSKTYQVQTWTETAGTHLSEISQGSELDIAFYETPVGYENTAFAGVDVIDEPALEEQDSGRATSPYEVLRPSTPTLPTGQDKTVNMDQEIFSQFSKRNIDTSKNDTKTHVEHHIKSQIFNEELDLSIEENTPEKKDILEEKSMRQTEVDRNMIVAQQIRSEIFAHELAEDIESDLPEGKDIPHDRENAENMRKIKIGAYEEKEEIMDQIISRYDMNIAQPNDKQVYENEFSEENISFIEKSEWEQKSKVVAVEHVMWETSVQQGSEEIIEEVVKELPREKQIIVEHEENESLEDSIDEENRDDEVIFSLRKEATKVAQDIIEDIKTEVSRCHTLEHSLSEISDEDLVEKSEEYMLSHQEVENLLKTRDKPEEKRVSFSEDIPEIPQITTEEIETLECDQIHTEEEECKSELEHYAHFKEIVLSSEQKVHQKETVKGEDSYIESKSSNGIKCEKEKEKYTIEAPKLPNELQKTLAQATGEKTDNFSQCLSSFEETRSDDKVVTFTNTEKETKEEIANIMTSEITLFEKVTEELKEKESDLLSTHAEDDEKMYKESIVEKLQKQDYMSSTPVILYEKQEEKTPSEEQLEFSSISTYTHVEKCISDDFIKTEKDKEIFDINLTPGENMQILERKHEFSQQPGGEYFDVNKETSVKKSELSENTTYRDIQSFTQQKESIILDSSEELTKSLYECDQLMKDEKKTTSGQKSTIHYKSEDSSFESVDLQEKAVIRDQTISEATVKSDDEKKNEYDKLEKFTSGRTTDLSELSNSTRKEKQINREGETYSSSGETDSHYYSFEMSDSGRTPRETPATSRPCSSEFDINISAPISSEYETCATSQEASGDISGSYSTAYTSQEISFATAHSSLSHSSQESAVSVDSESSGHLASVEISSEASETLVPSAQEIEQEFGRDVETPTPDGDEMAQAFIVREPYDSEIPEEVIRGGVEVPFLSDWKTKESFEASYQQSSGVIFSKWSNISELCEIPSSPFEIITEEDLADYPGDYVEHISESKCLDTYKTEESKLKDIHKLDKNSKEIKSHESILEHTTTDVVVVNETVQRTVGSEGQRSIYDEQTPILDGQLFSDEHALRSSIYRQESGAYLAAESVDDLTDQMSCSQEELSASESSVTHSEQTWLSSSVETTILATEQQVWPCSGAVSQDQQVTETMHIFTEQQFSTPELPDVVSEQPPEHSPHPSDLMLYPQLNGPVEVDYVPEYDATYPESQEQETEVESTFAEGTSTFAVTGESNSSDTQDTSEQTSLVETTRNVLLSGTEISAFLPSQIHQPESERVYAESQELQPPAVSLGHTVSEQYSESDSSEGDIQDIQTIQEIQELQEQEYGQEYETCRAEADEVYFQYYQRQYEENEEETQNFPCEVDKTVDWPESELLEEFYKSDKIAEVSDDQVDSEIKSVLSHAVESEQQKDLEDIERPMSPEPPYYSSLGEDDSYLPESDQGSAFLQKNISSAQETSLSHTSTTSTTQFAATEITSESISTDQQLVTCTESFSKQFQTDSHTSESFEIMDKNEVVDTKPEEDTYDIIFENQIQAVSSIEKSSSSKIQQGDIMEESLLSKAQKSCGQQCLTESHIATAVAEKFTIQAHQAYKHDIELDSDFQSKNMMEEDKDDKSSGEKVKYTCGIQFEIKKQHDLEEDSFGELYTHREEDEDGLEEIERASKTKPSFCEEINSSDLGVFADRKYTSKSEQDDKSVLSLQEFEKLELDVTIGQKSSLGLGDLVFDKTVLSKSEEVDDISLCSQTEFEQLEKECEEVGHEPTKEDFSKPFEIKESYHVQEITEDAASSESDDYEKRMSEIDEIIRQAQTNVEQFHSDHDQSLSESTGFTVKLQKYTGALSSESTESSLMEKTSSQKDDHDIDSLNGNEILERQASVEGYILETNEESIIHELETRPALLHHITVGRTVSGHSAESCDSQPRSSTSTVTQYDIESLREREAELEETEAVGDLKSRFFTDQRVEKYKTLVEHKDFMHEESDHFFCEDSIYEKKEIHAEESSLLSDKSADVDSLLEERADKDSLQEERDVDQDSLHEEMDLPDDQEDVLPGAQKASKQVIIKSSWHQRHLSDDECDKDSLKDEYLAGQDTSSSGKDGKDSGGKGDCMISSTDSLEPSSSTATHATYQFETDSVMSSSVNSVHTSGEESTMVSSTDTIEPEVVLSYSVGDMTEAAESHLIFSRNQVESQLQLKSEIRSLVKDADKNYKTIISQSMTQPSQLVICLSEEGTKPHMSHDGEQMLGKDAEMLSAGELSENYEIEAKDESKNQVVIHPVEEYIVCPEKLDSTVSEADVKEQLKDFIEKQASGVTYSNEPQKDHSVDEKGNLYITKMVKQHLKSEPQVMNYLDEETPEPSVASYVKKSFEAEKNIAVIEELSERKEENEIMDARGNQVIIHHNKDDIHQANHNIADSERVVEKHVKDCIPKQTIDIDYGDDEVEGHHSVDEKENVVITKTVKDPLKYESQGPEDIIACHLVTHIDDKNLESGSTSDAVEAFETEKDVSITFKDKTRESVGEIKTTDVKRNISYKPTISNTDNIEERLKELLKKQTLGVGKDQEEVEEHQKVDEKGNVIITRTVKRHVTSEPQIHKKTFIGPDAEKQTKEFFQSFDSLKPTEDEDHYEGVDEEGNMIRVTQKFVVKPEIHTVTFTGPDAHKQMEYFMKTWNESQDDEKDSNDAYCHRVKVYTNDPSGEGEKTHSFEAEPQYTQSQPVYSCASSLSKMHESDGHQHISSDQTDQGLESDPVFHLKTQEPTSAAGQMLDSGTHQFHYRDVSDGVPLPASLTRHTVYPQDERTVQFDPRECDHEFHSKLLSHFISEEENKEFGSDDWQQDSGDGHWTDQSTTEVRLETTHTTTTVGAVTETTTQHSDINKQDSLQQSMQEILNQFMTDEGSSQTVYHFDNDKE